MTSEEAQDLLRKYELGHCTPEEAAALESWYDRLIHKSDFDLGTSEKSIYKQQMLAQINSGIDDQKGKSFILWPRLVAAASIVICIGIGFYFYQKKQTTPTEITAKNDIAPGGNKAYLTLADGNRIALIDIKNGELAEQSGVKITKAADGQLIYTVSNRSNGNNKINTYNTIETPRGGTYQVRLPDGTTVWLNAASTVKYPVSFASLKERRVTLLSGEAYFEVAKDKRHPFIVQTAQQEVEVLGTHFNINNYRDESTTKTTLLEGKVCVKNKSDLEILNPGECSILLDNKFSVSRANIEEVIAWKNGYFRFNDENIINVMRRISRWYDVEIQYEKNLTKSGFNGTISRTKSITEVLRVLEKTNDVHFKIEGRRIMVMQ